MRPVAAPGTISRTVRRATKPATQPSTVQSTGPQGTPGGRPRKQGVGGRQLILGQEKYLWVLIVIELAATGLLRKLFRSVHGG